MTRLSKLSIAEAIEGLKKRDFSCVELVKEHIKNIEQQREINCYVLDSHLLSLEKAKDADNRYKEGTARSLEGIPVGVKDLFCTAGIRTTACSKILANFVPAYESTVTKNLFSEGAIMLGKTNMDEFAMGSSNLTSCFGPVKGPLMNSKNEYVVPGGSSGGSAAAVISYQAMASLGSDTGGSVRQPASFVGCVGVKPTYGRCSRYGMIAFSSSLDQAGVFARNVKDAALVLEAITGYDVKDSTSAKVPSLKGISDNLDGFNPKGLKIGIPKEYDHPLLHEDVKKQWHKTIDLFRKNGAEIIDISLPNTDKGVAAYYIIAPAEASSNLSRYDGVKYGLRVAPANCSIDEMYELTRAAGFGDEVKRRIIIGTYVLSSENYDSCYLQAQRVRRLIQNDFVNAFDKVDLIITPATTGEAFAMTAKLSPLDMYLNDVFTIPASLAGVPGMSVPVGLSSGGLPLGMQLITKSFNEELMLKAAHFVEKNVNYKNIYELKG